MIYIVMSKYDAAIRATLAVSHANPYLAEVIFEGFEEVLSHSNVRPMSIKELETREGEHPDDGVKLFDKGEEPHD